MPLKVKKELNLQTGFGYGIAISNPEVIDKDHLKTSITNLKKYKENVEDLYYELRKKILISSGSCSAEGIMVVDNHDVLLPYMEREIKKLESVIKTFDNLGFDEMKATSYKISIQHLEKTEEEINKYIKYLSAKRRPYIAGMDAIDQVWAAIHAREANKYTDELNKCYDKLAKIREWKAEFR